ncbi:MAG TPA: hypothetical protein VI306_04650 [Pyrinomonadaceae bacterium]
MFTAINIRQHSKLHTLHTVIRGRVFDGQFEAHGKVVRVNFVPVKAEVKDRRLVLTGKMGFTSPMQPARYVDPITATLLATQGGVGTSAVRRQLLAGTAQTAQTATSDQKLEQEKGPETDLQPGLHSFEPPRYDQSGRPEVESTEALAFVGVLYFKLSAIDNRALGINVDLSEVQLGVRLAPTDDLARDMQFLFSDVVMALHDNSNESLRSSLEGLNEAFRF